MAPPWYPQRLDPYTLTWDEGERIPVADILDQAERRWKIAETSLQPLPAGTDELEVVRSVPATWSRGYKMLVYQHWMCDESQAPPVTEWRGINSARLIGALARFRMGVHKLWIETGRHEPGRIPRDDRTCRLCELGAREDEAHFIFECPKFDRAREGAQVLFTDLPGPEAGLDARMRAFMNPRPGLDIPGGFWKTIAKYIYTCQEIHTAGVEALLEAQ